MVSLLFVVSRAENTMKNTIDDADYIINWIDLFVINQCVINPSHSHSIINKPFIFFYIQWLIFLLNSNTRKNTMLRKPSKCSKKLQIEH